MRIRSSVERCAITRSDTAVQCSKQCLRLIGLIILGVNLSACALHYVDSEGVVHVMGLVNMSIPTTTTNGNNIAESVQIQTVGVSLYSTPINSGMVIGYGKEQLTTVHNNAILGEPSLMGQRKE